MFEHDIGKKMKVYINDMIVKCLADENHPADLCKTFVALHSFGMSLNPKKCIFGVRSGKFLGFMIRSREIEANLDKLQTILDMKAPRNIKKVPLLTSYVAILKHFMSMSVDKYQPFFCVPKKHVKFERSQEAHIVFQSLKAYLSHLPKIVSPTQGKSSLIYLTVFE